MTLRYTYPVGLGVCLTLLALSAGGQTPTGNPSQSATGQGAAATANAPSSDSAGKPKPPAASTHKHHASAHHPTHVKHDQAAAANGNQETAYRTALKSCVAGPAGQRERCLDDAIGRYGRS